MSNTNKDNTTKTSRNDFIKKIGISAALITEGYEILPVFLNNDVRAVCWENTCSSGTCAYCDGGCKACIDCTRCTDDCTSSCTDCKGCTECTRCTECKSSCTDDCIRSCIDCTHSCVSECIRGCTECTNSCVSDCIHGCVSCVIQCTAGCTSGCIQSCTLACTSGCTNSCIQTIGAPHDSTILPTWNPDELSNPEIRRIAMSLNSIKVPPLPIPAKEVSMNWKELAFDDPSLAKLLNGGFIAWDMIGDIAKTTTHLKLILIAGKTFIAGEEGALVFLTKKEEIYENALKYLNNPVTSKQFVDLIRELKEKGEIVTAADLAMIEAVKAINDPSLGSSDVKIALYSMFSPEALAAMVQKAALELAMLGISMGASATLHQTDLPGRKAVFDSMRLERNKAEHLRKYADPKDETKIYELTRVITHENKMLENLYRTETVATKIAGVLSTLWPYKEDNK